MKKDKKSACEECSGTDVVHWVHKVSAAVDTASRYLSQPFKKIAHLASRPINIFCDYIFPRVFRLLAKIGIGKVMLEPDERDSMRSKMMWTSGDKRGIKVFQYRLFDNPANIFWAEYGGEKITFEALPRPKGYTSEALDWMDDKGVIKEIFQKNGVPTARGGRFFSFQSLRKQFYELEKPVIVKPSVGSRSRHTTIHIHNEDMLQKAFASAKKLSPFVILEEELRGSVFRIDLLGGKVAGILRRDPPFVFGDGILTIRELIMKENQNPKRHGIFHDIPIDEYTKRELQNQGLSLLSVPEKGRKIMLHPKVGRTQGGTNANVRKDAHEDNIRLFERIAEVLADPLIGVDFIMEDINTSWRKQSRFGVIECNSIPFLDLHHFPYEGEPVDMMSELWEVVFPKVLMGTEKKMTETLEPVHNLAGTRGKKY